MPAARFGTLASYAIGMRDNLCARPFGSHTYVAAVFAPEADEAAEAFTAVVAVEAQITGTREHGRNVELGRKQYLILPGTRLAEADFIASRQGSAITAVPVDRALRSPASALPEGPAFREQH